MKPSTRRSRGRWLWIGVALGALLGGCRGSSRSVALRVEGAAGCAPNVLEEWTAAGVTDVKTQREVALPWQSAAPPGSTAYGVVVTPVGSCARLECQVLVDGRQVQRQAAAGQIRCEWRR